MLQMHCHRLHSRKRMRRRQGYKGKEHVKRIPQGRQRQDEEAGLRTARGGGSTGRPSSTTSSSPSPRPSTSRDARSACQTSP